MKLVVVIIEKNSDLDDFQVRDGHAASVSSLFAHNKLCIHAGKTIDDQNLEEFKIISCFNDIRTPRDVFKLLFYDDEVDFIIFVKQNMETTIQIIGSGFSSLSAACYLAKRGHRVILHEKNNSVGCRYQTLFSSEQHDHHLHQQMYILSLNCH